MFDGLLGKKFTAKCKHAIKYIGTRMVTITRKKQAMLRYLRKDVAELIGMGLDANAFGRMDALIVEMNRTACYDMIGKFCESITIQLPTLQKKRECPHEAMEAVSTLIFAAARFSDLPELSDLRSVFTERYGSQMESSVNPEFVEKIQKKSFSMDKKLYLMQTIAQEFSVTWDCKACEQRISNSCAPVVDRPKKGISTCNINNFPSHIGNEKREVDTNLGNEEFPFKGRFEATPRSITQREVQSEPRNICVVSNISNAQLHGPAEKARDVLKNEPEKTEPISTKAAVPPYVKPKGDNNGIEKANQLQKGISLNRSPKAKAGNCLIGIGREAAGSGRTENLVPPYTISNKAGTNAEESQENCIAYKIPEAELVDPRRQEGEKVARANSSSDRVFSMTPPPYVKQTSSLLAHDKSDGGELTDHPKDNFLSVENSKPVSVIIRRQTKQQTVSEMETMVHAPTPSASGLRIQMVQQRAPTFDAPNDEREKIRDQESKLPSRNEIDGVFDANRTLGDRRRHGGRRSTSATYDGNNNVDEEERVMDRLLMHYSRKGIDGDCSNTRRKTRVPPANLVVDASKGAEQHGHDKVRHAEAKSVQHQRVAPFTVEPVSPNETKGPARASSFQSDMLNSNCVRVHDMHPRLPDLDELAARLIALRMQKSSLTS